MNVCNGEDGAVVVVYIPRYNCLKGGHDGGDCYDGIYR